MKPDELLEGFYLSNVDSGTIAQYLDGLARDDARTRLGHTRREWEMLCAEIARLEQEKAALEAEIARLGIAKLDHLVAFLPMFFRHFWTTVRPDELAMMCGRLDLPVVASPYLEPGPDTVRFLKRRFMALDVTERERILAFCRSLEHRLQPRGEMLPLLQLRQP